VEARKEIGQLSGSLSLEASHDRLGSGAASATPSGGGGVPSAAPSAGGYGLNNRIRERRRGIRDDEERIHGDGDQIHDSGINCDEKHICGDGYHGKRTSSSILSRYLPILILISASCFGCWMCETYLNEERIWMCCTCFFACTC